MKPTATLTVHDLAADWSTFEHALGFRVQRGRVVWEVAEYPESAKSMDRVRIQRLGIDSNGIPRCFTRWVDPDTLVELVTAE